jgi:membrane-associated protein
MWSQIDWLLSLANPDRLRELINFAGPPWVRYAFVMAIVFSETGLMIGFFLPGDSLLFAVGLLASQNFFSLPALMASLSLAAILGDSFNYFLGRQAGEYVFEKGRIRWIKHDHLLAAKAFYERHGGKAVFLARFVPLVRSFAPFVAGVARMQYGRFVAYSVTGGISWIASMSLAGYWLGQINWVRENFELIVGIVLVSSVMPLILGAVRGVLQRAKSRASSGLASRVPVEAGADSRER